MRPDFNNDDYAIACCVSPMIVGKQMQFFGARANLAKTMLYAINGGVDEKLKMQVGPKSEPIKGDVLNYDEVMERMDHFMDWLAKQYITALNIIHYMHDKYSYEASLMALHDRDVIRTMLVCPLLLTPCLQSNMRKLNRFVTKTVWLSTSKSKANTRSLVTMIRV